MKKKSIRKILVKKEKDKLFSFFYGVNKKISIIYYVWYYNLLLYFDKFIIIYLSLSIFIENTLRKLATALMEITCNN